MNLHYTNRIEGQHTRPHETDQALRQDFSNDAALAAKQRLAVAHIEAQEALEQHDASASELFNVDAAQSLPREWFSRLPAADLLTPEGEANVPDFLARWASFYGGVRRGKVRFGLPQHALRFIFPRLWPEAEADAASLRA